jgi:hypothetical protein
MFDVCERRPVEFGDLRQFEYALVDVKKRRVAVEAAGELGRGDAHLGKGGGFRGRADLAASAAQRVASATTWIVRC